MLCMGTDTDIKNSQNTSPYIGFLFEVGDGLIYDNSRIKDFRMLVSKCIQSLRQAWFCRMSFWYLKGTPVHQ